MAVAMAFLTFYFIIILSEYFIVMVDTKGA